MKSPVLVLAIALLSCAPQPALAMEAPEAPTRAAGVNGEPVVPDTVDVGPSPHAWQASLEYTRATLAPELPHAETIAAGVARRFAWGSLGAQVLRAERFALRDEAVVLDSYFRLWPGAYTNLRIQTVREAEVLPSTDAGLDLFQAGPHGWEISGGYRRQVYATSPVDVYAVTLGRYSADWYLRGRTTLASVAAETAAAYAISARRYLETTGSFTEITAGLGHEVVDLLGAPDTGVVVDLRQTRFAALHTRAFFSPSLGASATVSVNRYEHLSNRVGVSFGLLARW